MMLRGSNHHSSQLRQKRNRADDDPGDGDLGDQGSIELFRQERLNVLLGHELIHRLYKLVRPLRRTPRWG